MAWFATTRWTDNETNGLEECVELILQNNDTMQNDGSINYANLTKSKKFDTTQMVTIDERKISYNVIEFFVDAITPGSDAIEARTQNIRGLIIIFSDGGRVNYLINRNYDALKLLRKLLGYTKKNEISENNLSFNDDVFMWFVKKVFLDDSTFSFTQTNQTEIKLVINSIIGVRGETRDDNRLSAQGNTVLNLISTLSFLLESNLLKQIILRIEYTGHENIEVRLNDKGVIAVEINAYSGKYEEYDEYKLKTELLLLIYLDLLPKLLQVYYSEKDEDKWSVESKDTFFNLVQNKLIERLEERRTEVSKQQSTTPLENTKDEEKLPDAD